MDKNIRIAVTGDFCPVYKNGELLAQNKFEEVFGDFNQAIGDKDIHITNLESPLTNSQSPISKNGPPLKSSPEMIGGLTYARVDVACLANNHILDFGEQGVLDTIDVCHKNGIQTVGAGSNLESAGAILYLNVKGKSIAVINIAEHEFTIATETTAGANPLNITANYRSIAEAKKKADIVMVISHGGNEYYPLPSPRVVENYRFFADAGADIVIAHHPHCYSGYEVHNGVPIFYSLGNYIFDWNTPRLDSWYTGLLLMLEITDKGISFELKPFYQSKAGIGFKMLQGAEKENILKDIDRLSAIIADKEKLKKEWLSFCNGKKIQYYNNIFGFNKVSRNLYKMPIFKQLLVSKRKKLMLLNMVDCEAHKEVVAELLNKDITN